MCRRNPLFERLPENYLFHHIAKEKRAFLEKNPGAKLISLGIGDTTQHIPTRIAAALADAAKGLGTPRGYSGYGPEQGEPLLRERIAEKIYGGKRSSEEIFISDGAKCDIGRLQLLFGSDASLAVQDPTYPAYVDSGLLTGKKKIVYMPCLPENSFFPDLEKTPKTELIFFASPNNPTGAVATKEQLERLVAFAKNNRSILLFDAAYALFCSGVRSIYEIEGADEVAIEIGSFSKIAGFTGVRLGWSVVPDALCYDDGFPIKKDWGRITSTFFNGASNIAQKGGVAALEESGMEQMRRLVSYYMDNAALIRKTLSGLGFETYGGEGAPYLWSRFPGRSSWELFRELLEKAQIVATPGSGFGPSGEGFIRFSAFGSRHETLEAMERLTAHFTSDCIPNPQSSALENDKIF